MITNIRDKIRALVVDVSKSSFETFLYTTTNIFTIAEQNITITKVLLNGEENEDYTFDEDTNKITITASGLTTSDVIEVDYTYYKYSDTEIDEYIKSALVWVSVYSHDEKDYEYEIESSGTGTIVPTPENRTEDLIAIVASILIKPNYSSYKLPNVTVTYPEKLTKEEKIEKLVTKFNMGLGLNCIIEYNEYES